MGQTFQIRAFLLIISITIIISACGSSGGGSSPVVVNSENQPSTDGAKIKLGNLEFNKGDLLLNNEILDGIGQTDFKYLRDTVLELKGTGVLEGNIQGAWFDLLDAEGFTSSLNLKRGYYVIPENSNKHTYRYEFKGRHTRYGAYRGNYSYSSDSSVVGIDSSETYTTGFFGYSILVLSDSNISESADSLKIYRDDILIYSKTDFSSSVNAFQFIVGGIDSSSTVKIRSFERTFKKD